MTPVLPVAMSGAGLLTDIVTPMSIGETTATTARQVYAEAASHRVAALARDEYAAAAVRRVAAMTLEQVQQLADARAQVAANTERFLSYTAPGF